MLVATRVVGGVPVGIDDAGPLKTETAHVPVYGVTMTRCFIWIRYLSALGPYVGDKDRLKSFQADTRPA